MSFRKKNIVLGVPAAGAPEEFASKLGKGHAPGIRPSPLDGRLTISTGTASLDQCLSGHAGLPLGNAILLEESGTTDFSGVVLKYYAAEGLVQGHHVHVFGVGDAWRSELPGLSQLPRTSKVRNSNGSDDKMKIAWRYESLSRGGEPPNSSMGEQHITDAKSLSVPFCHTFDLTTKLESRDCKGDLDVIRPTMPTTPKHTAQKIPSLLQLYTVSLAEAMRSSPQGSVHRVVVPNLLSPASYGPSTSKPSEVLQFLHALRALLRKYGSRLSAMISVSTALYSRSTGLVRWMEALLDGVVELVPLQQPVHAQPGSKSDDAAQGMLNIHRLPVFGELGIGPGGRLSQENLSFKLSSSSGLVIKPYSLPPVGDTADANDAGSTDTKRRAMDSPEANSGIEQIRISKIADRYLVFDADHVSILRRRHHLCSVLVGSTPQNPTQNVFLSLPLELLPEEAALLLDQKAAVLADEATSHLAALKQDRRSRKQYIDQLNDRRQQAKQHLAEGQAQKAAQSRELAAKARSQGGTAPEHARSSAHGNVDSDRLGTVQNPHLADEPKIVADRSLVKPLTITNTTSLGLILPSVSSTEHAEAKPAVGRLHAHLLSQGYFMTPGLRFGAKYSVYPGDPLRYHAHFLATDYEWEEEISMLDMVGSGRLGTSVKKGFLLGGEVPRKHTTGGGDSSIRAFCIEWAGM